MISSISPFAVNRNNSLNFRVKHVYPILFIFSFLSAEIYDVSIPENDTASYNYADFRMWVNDSTDTLRGIYWFMHPNNGDSRNIVTDSAYQALASGQGFALMGAHIFNMHMNTGIGDAVIAAMDSFAVLFRHDELEFVPFFVNGYSWGGQFGYHFTKWIPERVVGFITQKGGYHDTTDAGDAIEVPGLMFVGENDLPYRIENLTGIFFEHRPLGAKWILAIEQNAGHSQVIDYSFLDSFFNIITDLRIPNDVNVFEPIELNTIPDSIGWFGDQNSWIIGSFDCYDGLIDSSSWFPSKNVGERWQYFVSEGGVTDTSECDGSIGIDIRIPVPTNFRLYHPYPNPFNPTTTLRFDIPSNTTKPVLINIYDITGSVVETMINETIESGHHEIQWNVTASSSGLYFVELRIGEERLVQKLLYIK